MFLSIRELFDSAEDDSRVVSLLASVGLLLNDPDFPYNGSFEEFGISQVLVSCLDGADEPLRAVSLAVATNCTNLVDRTYTNLLLAHGLLPALFRLADRYESVFPVLSNLCVSQSHRLMIRGRIGIADVFGRLLTQKDNPSVYIDFLFNLCHGGLSDSDLPLFLANLVKLIDVRDDVEDCQSLFVIVMANTNSPNFHQMSAAADLGQRIVTVLGRGVSAVFGTILLSILSILLEVRSEFEFDIEVLLDCCRCPDTKVRTAAVFCAGNLSESRPEVIPALVSGGLLNQLDEMIGGGQYFEAAEAVVCLSSMIVFGEGGLCESLDLEFFVGLLADTVMTFSGEFGCLRRLATRAVVRLLECCWAENGVERMGQLVVESGVFDLMGEFGEEVMDDEDAAVMSELVAVLQPLITEPSTLNNA
jgi:hypothetical protein